MPHRVSELEHCSKDHAGPHNVQAVDKSVRASEGQTAVNDASRYIVGICLPNMFLFRPGARVTGARVESWGRTTRHRARTRPAVSRLLCRPYPFTRSCKSPRMLSTCSRADRRSSAIPPASTWGSGRLARHSWYLGASSPPTTQITLPAMRMKRERDQHQCRPALSRICCRKYSSSSIRWMSASDSNQRQRGQRLIRRPHSVRNRFRPSSILSSPPSG